MNQRTNERVSGDPDEIPAATDADGGPAQSESAPREPAQRSDSVSLRFAALASPRFAVPIILIAGGVLFLLNLGGYPVYTKGEAREAVTVFDIVKGGGVILPMRAGVEIPSKPLLMHWLAALVSLAAGGVNEWTVRLPSAIFAIGGMLLCYLYLRRLFNQRVALLASLIAGTSIQYLQAGAGARVDMTLVFFTTVAFFEFIAIAEGVSSRVTVLYLAIAAAVLTKGPIGLALPLMVAAIWTALWRRWEVLQRLRLWRGALIVGVIGGGWYAAAIAVGGFDFVRKQILAENLYRLIQHRGFHEAHAHPFYYIEAALAAGFLPWTPVGLVALTQRAAWRKRSARFGYLIVWFLTVLVFFNLPQSKRGVYLLPLYPALCAIVAVLLLDADGLGELRKRWVDALLRITGACIAAVGLAGLAGLVLLDLRPDLIAAILSRFGILVDSLPSALRASVTNQLVAAIVIAALTIAIGTFAASGWGGIEAKVSAIAAGMLTITVAVNLFVQPAIAETLSLKTFARETVKLAGAKPVGYFGSLDYGFAFYSGRNVIPTSPRNADAPAMIVTDEDGWKVVGAKVSVNYRVLLRSNPTDLDGSGRMLLLQRINPLAAASISSNRATPAK